MQKTILKRALSLLVCLAVLIAGMPLAIFNVGAEASPSVITDNFDGELNWSSLTSDANPIRDGKFYPTLTGVKDTGLNDIFTLNNWPDRKVVSVEGTYLNTYWGSVFIYDYEDENNWRGFYLQKATNLNFWYVFKESDPENPDKVYFYKSPSSAYNFWQNKVELNELAKFRFDYNTNNTISFTMVALSDATRTNTLSLPMSFTPANTNGLTVSTDGGATFEAATEIHTFSAIENARDCEFAIGSGTNETYIDDLVITFEKSDADYVAEFKAAHAAILAKTIETVTAEDEEAIANALSAYEALSEGAKASLSTEYTLLNQLGDAIIAGAFNVGSFTDDFSGDNYWVQVGDGENATITNEAFFPGASADINNGKATVNVHKYWPERQVKSVSGVLNTVYFTPVAIYYYKDANNWRGFFYQVASNAHGRYIMKESDPADPNKVYYYYSTTNNKHGFIEKPTDNKINFDISYDSNSSITYKATIYKGTENEVTNSVTFGAQETVAADKLMVSTDGGKTFSAATEAYTFSAITDAKSSQFAMGYSQTGGGSFDDIKVTFEKSNAEYAEEFKVAHKDILAKTTETVAITDKEAIDAALADYEALSDGVKALVADEYALLGALSAKIAELELNVIVAAYKDTHEEILAKTSSTVLASDKAAVEAALADFEALSDAAKAKLTDEKALLTVLLEVATAAGFDATSFTDDFSGDNNWVQVGSGAESTIVDGEFYPGASTNLTGNISVHTHKYWPDRKLNSVSGSYRTAALSSLMIYYYKDANNWRGFYSHNGSMRHARFVMKATDPATGDVYFWYSNTNNIASIAEAKNNPMAFELIYEDDATIKLRLDGQERIDTISGARTSIAGQTFVSTDGGANFSAIDGTYTFPAITDAKSAMFAMGNGQNASRFDNLTFNFEESTANLVAAYLNAHKDILSKNVEDVVASDKAAILAAIADYEALNADAKEELADEYALLNSMTEALYATTMDGASYTETFEGDYLWKAEGGNAPANVIKDVDDNKVFAPGGVGSIGAPVVYTHKYWQDKVLTSVTGKMYISDRSLSSTYPSNVIVYNYKDADNWRGVYFTNILTDTGDLFSQPVKFIGKENGVNKTYYYYSLGNKEFSIENRVTTFTITYNENGTASLVLTNDTGTSSTIDLINDCVGGYVERVNNNYGAFGVASVTGASGDDWFDDITFNFGETFEQKAETFKATYAETLALDLETVTNDNKLEIAALYDAYNKIARNDKMATLLSAEGEKVDALIEAVKAYNKNTTDAIRIAFVGDSNTESGNMNGGPLAEVGYPYMVQQELNRMYGEGKFVVGNFGISGKTAREYYQFVYDGNGNYLKRGMLESLFFDPDIVVLCLGGNDALYSTDEAFEYYYKKLADEYVALVGEENFIATAPIHHYHSIENNCPKRREAIKTMADANGWSFFNLYADTYDFLINNRDVYDSVGLHPVQAYDVLANAAVNYLDKNILGQYDLDKIVSEEFEEFEETYTMSGTEVTADNLDAINEALAKYETLTDAQKATYAEEKAALEAIKAIATLDKEVKNTVITPANVSIIAEKQAAYEALGVDNAAIEESIANLQETVDSFSSQVLGCSIKTDADPTKQDLRYEYEAPQWDAPEGWYVKEYGAIFYPAAALGNNPLTLETPKIATGAGELNPDGSVPSTFRANLVGSALKSINCSMDIAGTAYVIWTDGTNEYVCYSNNTVDNSGYTENNVVNGVGVRSVYKTARKIAAAIYGTTEYGTVNYTEKVTEGGDLATFANADILEFVSKNIDAITNYVGKNQGE